MPKLIPYTRSLLLEMRRAFDPWVGSLYLRFPSLFLGKHYWALSPNTKAVHAGDTMVPIGFPDDTIYVSPLQRRALRQLLAAPPEVAGIEDPDAFNYVTLLFLLRERNLRLMSVWHPSFLTILLDALPRHWDSILLSLEKGAISDKYSIPESIARRLSRILTPDEERATELASLPLNDPALPIKAWPRMRVISCWTDGHAASWLDSLRQRFPGVFIQPKGLLATEGVVSFPLGKAGPVCAIRSHVFEFEDSRTGDLLKPHELVIGEEYAVIISTAGGLTRYKLHDVVRVDGYYHDAPCFCFVGRDNRVCDLVGEKLAERHAAEAIAAASAHFGTDFRFAMLAPTRPDNGHRGYVLFLESGQTPVDAPALQRYIEQALCHNYHYAHALRRGQLAPLRVFLVHRDGSAIYRQRFTERGMKAGDVKIVALSPLSDWDTIFPGRYIC